MAALGGRCEEHKKEAWATSTKKTPAERGYGWQWQKKRKVILKRDDWMCQECLRNGIYTQGTDVDHIKPKHLGGTDEESNLELLCRECHKVKTQRESQNARN